ncbi:MAG TPA: hypothetical protein VN081_01560 [Dongiaceae bacterium]|nr:hypothetical protein [Dongiaceae bacterium]
MSTTEKVLILFIEPGKGEYVDGDMDALNASPFGILTWRREGQMVSDAAQLIFSFDAEDAMVDHSVTFVERLVDFNRGEMTREFAMTISSQFHRSIREAIAQHGDNWGYFHSERHRRLLVHIQEEAARMDRGELAPWERELLGI